MRTLVKINHFLNTPKIIMNNQKRKKIYHKKIQKKDQSPSEYPLQKKTEERAPNSPASSLPTIYLLPLTTPANQTSLTPPISS